MARPDKALQTLELLRAARLRATPQRRLLIELLRTRTHRPVSVEELHTLGTGKFDLTTAYRTLETLSALGLVRRIAIDHNRALFELAGEHHHHAICTSCGRIEDVSTCVSPSLDEKVRKSVRFSRINSHALEFFGVCTKCAVRV